MRRVEGCLIGIESIGGSDGSRGCSLISDVHFLAGSSNLVSRIKSEFDNAMTRINALVLLSQVFQVAVLKLVPPSRF